MISVEQWEPADGLTLEPNALKAVLEQEKCLALTAGLVQEKRKCRHSVLISYFVQEPVVILKES